MRRGVHVMNIQPHAYHQKIRFLARLFDLDGLAERGLLQHVAQDRATLADTGIHARLVDTAPLPVFFSFFPIFFLGAHGAVSLFPQHTGAQQH